MRLIFIHKGEKHAVDAKFGAERHHLAVDGTEIDAHILSLGQGELEFEVDGKVKRALWAREGRRIWVHVDGRSYEFDKLAAGQGAAGAGNGSLRAPMPGQVRKLLAAPGEAVVAGAVLMVLEAMKMEIRIQAPQAGRVKSIHVKESQTVDRDQLLLELDA
jgi:biotin carboxyl carrier protein